MPKPPSAGLLLYRKTSRGLEVFLGHPGGPFFARKDNGSWEIPKGQYEQDEEPLAAAYREFKEEIGCDAPVEDPRELTTIRRKDGKIMRIWAVEDTNDVRYVGSNLIDIDWPPRTGKKMTIPEVDRAEWFPLAEAREKIIASQIPFLDELEAKLLDR